MPSPMRVSLIGLGALGILYSDILSRRPDLCTLTCVADRERQARYAKEGVFCNNVRLDLTYAAPEDKPSEPAELVIVAVKGTTLASAINDIRNQVGPGTVLVSLLNGITSEVFLETAFPEAKVLRAVAQGMDALRERQRMVSSAAGMLLIGAPKGRDDLAEPLDRVVGLLRAAGVPCAKDEDIEHRLYAKWMFNVGINQTVTVFRGTYGTVQVPGEARDMCVAAMREAKAIACAEGVDLTEADVTDYITLMDKLRSDSMPSMRQDSLAGRPTEKALFAGTVLEKGRALGIAAPVNEKLYYTLTEMEKM